MDENFVTDGVTVETGQPTETEIVESTLSTPDPVPDISAWEKPFAEYSVSEFLLLLIAVLFIVKTVLGLFTRKWGFPEW